MLISRRPRHLLGPLCDSCLRLPPLGLRFHQSGRGRTAGEGWMPTRSGCANLYTLEMTPTEERVPLIDHITGARCALLRGVRGRLRLDIGYFSSLRFNPARCDWTAANYWGDTERNPRLRGLLGKGRHTEEAALIKAGLCSTSGGDSICRTWHKLRDMAWNEAGWSRKAKSPAPWNPPTTPTPQTLSAQRLWIGKDCSEETAWCW